MTRDFKPEDAVRTILWIGIIVAATYGVYMFVQNSETIMYNLQYNHSLSDQT